MSHLNHETLVRTANELPPLPAASTKLMKLYADEDYEMREVVKVIELDPTLTGRLLRVANSIAYGTRPVRSTSEAVMRVGGGVVLSVSLSQSTQPSPDLDLSSFNLTPESYWNHSVAAMSCAEELRLQVPRTFSEELPLCALMHDFGKLVLSQYIEPEHLERMAGLSNSTAKVDREMAVLGVNHAEVGAVVTQAWKLPESIVKAIQYHHRPEVVDTPLCYGLCIANHLARKIESTDGDCDLETSEFKASLAALNIEDSKIAEIIEKTPDRFSAMLAAYA